MIASAAPSQNWNKKRKKEKKTDLDCTQLRKNSNCLPTCQEPYPLEPEQGGFEYQLACWLISLMHPQSFLQLKELCLLLHICEASKMPLLSGQKAAKKKKLLNINYIILFVRVNKFTLSKKQIQSIQSPQTNPNTTNVCVCVCVCVCVSLSLSLSLTHTHTHIWVEMK